MIKFSVCYSNKAGMEFASCGLSDIELDHSMLDNPTALRDKIATIYELCEQMVNAQLGTAAAPPAPAINPAIARINQAPPAPASSPSTPPVVNAPATADRPPTSARSLGGWAKKHGHTKWFSDLGRANHRQGLIYEWDDAFAIWAYEQWLATQSAPAVPSTNGNGYHPH